MLHLLFFLARHFSVIIQNRMFQLPSQLWSTKCIDILTNSTFSAMRLQISYLPFSFLLSHSCVLCCMHILFQIFQHQPTRKNYALNFPEKMNTSETTYFRRWKPYHLTAFLIICSQSTLSLSIVVNLFLAKTQV